MDAFRAHYVLVHGSDFNNGTPYRSATDSVVCSTGAGSGTYYYNFDNQVPDKMPYTCPSRSQLGVYWDRAAGDVTFDIHA